ncbi:hypothetical protein N9Y42_08780 [Mariniblastus sp.]|nr:hypothetical protein [Mariniblastus sp.]
MGHSFTEFDDERFLAHDHRIKGWIHFFADVAQESSDTPSELLRIARGWIEHFTWAGNGCIDLELDTRLADDVLRKQFREFAERTQSRIGSFGEAIPANQLNRLQGLDERSGYQADIPVKNLLSYGHALLKIIDKT